MMELTADEHTRLRAGMSRAFQDFSSLHLFLVPHCGRFPADWTAAEVGMQKVIGSTIDCAVQTGWLDELLTSFKLYGPNYLASTSTTILIRLTAQRPPLYEHTKADPLGALFIAKEECFIGRDSLRESLRLLELDAHNRSVLCVAGSRTTGKSYSFELLKLLDNLSPVNVVVRIDFKDFRVGALTERYRDIIIAINTRLQMPFEKIPIQNQTESRWFENAIITFDNVVRERGQKLWLVFDHIPNDKREIDPSMHEALSTLVRYATMVSQRLRIVLIDIEHSDLRIERGSQRRVGTDFAVVPTEVDIRNFLCAVQRAAKVSRTDEEIEGAVSIIVSDLCKCAPDDYVWELSPLTWTQVVRLNLTGGAL